MGRVGRQLRRCSVCLEVWIEVTLCVRAFVRACHVVSVLFCGWWLRVSVLSLCGSQRPCQRQGVDLGLGSGKRGGWTVSALVSGQKKGSRVGFRTLLPSVCKSSCTRLELRSFFFVEGYTCPSWCSTVASLPSGPVPSPDLKRDWIQLGTDCCGRGDTVVAFVRARERGHFCTWVLYESEGRRLRSCGLSNRCHFEFDT